MIEKQELLEILNNNYEKIFTDATFHRDGGSLSYIVFSNEDKYFLRVIRPEMLATAYQAIDIHTFLQVCNFAVPPIVFTKDDQSFITRKTDGKINLLVLYEYIEGKEPSNGDIENVGELIAKLHNIMESYPKELKNRDKHFFIDRYVDILRSKNDHTVGEYERLGNMLWGKVKDLPKGFCHCDLYSGNIMKSDNGKLYVLDFDTSCNGFPMYDITLFCNETDYFAYSDEKFHESELSLQHFLKGYMKHRNLTEEEIQAFYYFQVIYHFQLQATIVEIYGIDCNPDDFEDKQLDWITSWMNKAEQEKGIVFYI
ncbi:MAG: phosphotransferase [Defluviitaleaceae bacterium]|nr:phosphotransferase [Defluviitaleaceae bacterium]